MGSKRYAIRPANKVLIWGIIIILLIFALMSCSISYRYRRAAILLECDSILEEINAQYTRKVHSLADVYAPIFKTSGRTSLMRAYFAKGVEGDKAVLTRAELVLILTEMIAQDNDIVWIALWNPALDANHCLFRGGSRLSLLPDDFPYPIDSTTQGYRLHGAHAWQDENGITRLSYVVQGGPVSGENTGGILVGYALDSLERIVERGNAFDETAFMVIADDQVVFDSQKERYGTPFSADMLREDESTFTDTLGEKWHARIIENSARGYTTAYIIPWIQLFLRANADTPAIAGVLLLFALFALGLSMLSTRHIYRRVREIRQGLTQIGQSHLDYRLGLSDRRDEFDEISANINAMTALLQEGIEKEYVMRLRQVHLELRQIQARFNPHFLYNTLELIRGRLFSNGDLETAEYIEKLARIFRNLTDARTVVSIRDEVSFCSLYASLLQLRYQNAVNIYYDIAPELQDCAILANLIQPVIENYFVHSLDESAQSNELEIICTTQCAHSIRIIVANNGMGLAEDRMREINETLQDPDATAQGYGLLSIAKRIRLFYGPSYGIQMEHNPGTGIRVVMTIARMDLDTHEKKLMMYN